ncbi:hypothetical protein NQD34_015673 [Periophthalmus magnuspinnatus]|nr:hypothetical protein NQD34_015673 [Periophthalmus magnuspinnatus]
MSVFQHCSVLFELKGLPFKDKKKIKLAVTDNGGNMAFVASKQCSLVVASGVSSLSPSRVRNIVKYQIPVVGVEYVHRCLEANCRLPVEDFKLGISLPVKNKDNWSQSKDTAPNSQAIPLQPVSQRVKSPMGRTSVVQYKHREYTEMDHGLPKFPKNFQVAKYSVFQKPNSQCWCLLELQSAKRKTGRQYRVVKYWKEDIQSKGVAVRDHMAFLSKSEEAVAMFQDLTDSMKTDGLKQQRDVPPQVSEIGSAPLQQLLLEEKLNIGALSPEVGLFVELLWQEALGCINLTLITPVHKISLNDVTRAEGLLLQVQRKITDHKMEEALSLWSEYYTLLPTRFPVSPNMSEVSKQFDLCQLIRDILNVSEMTLGSAIPSSVGKYRALRCGIEAVPPDSLEFEAVTSLLQTSKIQVHQIYQVIRAPELQNFKTELGNIQPLLHSSSPHNFVGILSRGLLMPHVAVDQHGIQRTDAGNLGSGIYFTDNIKTTLKYSQCSSTDGSRLMLVCDVALGWCKDLLEKDLTLTQAPEDYDSVHGVQNKPGVQSEFTDDEYVVYSADQVKLKYVVRFSMEGDELKNFTPEIDVSEEPSLLSPEQGPGTVEDGIGDIKNPLENVTAGLLNSSGQQIPLQAVHVKCKLMDLLAQVIIFQKYTNQSAVPIEAKYVFPLDDSAAVSGFEAFINGKHVVGQVKEKETARRQYKQAIEKGHGAYLMDQDAPDVFTISVGNLPPGATVLIKVTFVSELIVKDGSVFFSLPSSVAPWQETAALNQTTQVTLEKVCVTDEGANAREFNLDMSVEMPHEITEVKCTTHKVKMKKTDCKAVVSVLPGEVMGPEGFQLLVTLTEVHVPRMWVEKHPSKDSQACMLVFYPRFEAPSCRTSDEVVLLLDASQSMKGESLNTARMLALQILNNLDQNVQLNVIFFGTDHTEAFLSARPVVEARQEAKKFIKHFSSVGGSTELWRPLRALSLLPPSSGTRNLLLLSDGHIQSPELTLRLIRENSTHSRLFTCGLSPTANRHMLRALAQAGGGAYEFFDTKSKHTWLEKVTSQIKRMLAPGARSVSVKWQQFNPTAPPLVQAPKHLHALFNDCHTLVFGFVPHCTQATLLGNLGGEEIKTMVSTSELQKTKGTFLHKLTARAIIRDFEDGSLDSDAVLHEEKKAELKSFVIELSKEFSILSQFTSFVAIEERDSEEERGFTDIPKLIAEEDVDFLPYMCWAEEESTLEMEADDYLDYEEDCSYRSDSESLLDITLGEQEVQEVEEVEDDYREVEVEGGLFSFCSPTKKKEGDEIKENVGGFTISGLWRQKSISTMPPPPASHSALLRQGQMSRLSDSADQKTQTPAPPHTSHPFGSVLAPWSFGNSLAFDQQPPPPPPPAQVQKNTIAPGAPPPAPPHTSHPFGSVLAPWSFGSSLAFDQQPPPPPPPAQVQKNTIAPGAPPPAPPHTSHPFGSVLAPWSFGSSLAFGQQSAPPPPPALDEDSFEFVPVACQAVRYSFKSSEPRAEKVDKGVLRRSLDFGQQPPPPPPPAQVQKPTIAPGAPPPAPLPRYSIQDQSVVWLAGPYESSQTFTSVEDSVKGDTQTLPVTRRVRTAALLGASLGREAKALKQPIPYTASARMSKWQIIFSLQHPEGYWELTKQLGRLLNCNIFHFASDFLKRKGIASLGLKAHMDILKLLATLLVLQLMRLENIKEGQMLRTLFCLEDSMCRPDHWEAVNKAVKWVRWADRQYPCIYSRLEFGLSWDSSTKQLLGAERIHHCSPLIGLNLNPSPYEGPIMQN